MTTKIELGDEVQDTVTKFKGIAIARTTWIHGCDRICVQPVGTTKEGKTFDNCTFDELQLVVLKTKSASKTVKKSGIKTGGPRNDKAALKANKTGR